jgi:hypothetical protein
MEQEYYHNLLLQKMKKDVFNELSERCTNEQELNEILTTYFNGYQLSLKSVPKKKGEKYRDRCKYSDRSGMCLARVWNCGVGGQCSRKGGFDGFCKYHLKPATGPGGSEWWLGTIDIIRPTRPMNHNGKIHLWND